MISERKIDAIKKAKPFTIADVIVFGVVGILIALLIVFSYAEPAAMVQIRYNGKTTSYPLERDAEIDVDGKLTVVIKNKEVYVKDATCPDKSCEHSGTIRRVNRMIVCAPYSIIIVISGEDGGKWVN